MGYSSVSPGQYSIRSFLCKVDSLPLEKKVLESSSTTLCTYSLDLDLWWVPWDIWRAGYARLLHLFCTYCVDILTNLGTRQNQWNVSANALLQAFWLAGRSSFTTDVHNNTATFGLFYILKGKLMIEWLLYIFQELKIAANHCVFGDDLCYCYTVLSDWLLSTAEAPLCHIMGTPPQFFAHRLPLSWGVWKNI